MFGAAAGPCVTVTVAQTGLGIRFTAPWRMPPAEREVTARRLREVTGSKTVAEQARDCAADAFVKAAHASGEALLNDQRIRTDTRLGPCSSVA